MILTISGENVIKGSLFWLFFYCLEVQENSQKYYNYSVLYIMKSWMKATRRHQIRMTFSKKIKTLKMT